MIENVCIVSQDKLKMKTTSFFIVITNCNHHKRSPFLRKCGEVDETFESFDEIEKFRFVLNYEAMQIETANYAQESFFYRKNTNA